MAPRLLALGYLVKYELAGSVCLWPALAVPVGAVTLGVGDGPCLMEERRGYHKGMPWSWSSTA